MIDSSSIYIKNRVTSGKIPAQVPTKSPAVGSTLRRRTWGTWSCKNLMKACLRCQSVKSVHWATKKAYMQTEVMYGKSRVVVAISKSFFLLEEQRRGILIGYCRDVRPSKIYRAWGPIQGYEIVRGGVNIIREIHVSE